MERQATEIASWGENVYVKIPVTNTRDEFTGPIIRSLSGKGVRLNITAVFTPAQTRAIAAALTPGTPALVSVFAGRIADTGLDPLLVMPDCLSVLQPNPLAELLWASPRELFNIVQADRMGCHILTVTQDVLAKLDLLGKNNDQYSLETVQRSEEHTSELQSLMRISYAVFCLKKKNKHKQILSIQ